MLIDSSLCLLIAQEMADWLECPSNFTVNFPFDLYFSWLVDHKSFRNNLDTYHDYLLTEGTNTINNNISSKLCILPNFYCDTCNTNFYCNPNQERQWLLDFYTSTNGKHWKNNSNWNVMGGSVLVAVIRSLILTQIIPTLIFKIVYLYGLKHCRIHVLMG